MCLAPSRGPRRALGPSLGVPSSPLGLTVPRPGPKSKLALSHQEDRGPLRPDWTARLKPSRAWHPETGPPEGLGKGQGAQKVGGAGREVLATQGGAEQAARGRRREEQSGAICVRGGWRRGGPAERYTGSLGEGHSEGQERARPAPPGHVPVQAQPPVYSRPQLLSEAARDTALLPCAQWPLSAAAQVRAAAAAGMAGRGQPRSHAPALHPGDSQSESQGGQTRASRQPAGSLCLLERQTDSQREGGPTAGRDRAGDWAAEIRFFRQERVQESCPLSNGLGGCPRNPLCVQVGQECALDRASEWGPCCPGCLLPSPRAPPLCTGVWGLGETQASAKAGRQSEQQSRELRPRDAPCSVSHSCPSAEAHVW